MSSLQHPGSAAPGKEPPRPSELPDTLRALYERYRDVEVGELLALIPREGLRSLWRHRVRAEPSAGAVGDGSPSLDHIREAAASVLPLPPYEIWVRSYLADRSAYLKRMGVPDVPSRPDPVTISTRCVEEGLWAHLNLLNRDGTWVGFIAFHGPVEGHGGGMRTRTADIFRGDDPAEIRDRFETFTPDTLRAFLRSVA